MFILYNLDYSSKYIISSTSINMPTCSFGVVMNLYLEWNFDLEQSVWASTSNYKSNKNISSGITKRVLINLLTYNKIQILLQNQYLLLIYTIFSTKFNTLFLVFIPTFIRIYPLRFETPKTNIANASTAISNIQESCFVILPNHAEHGPLNRHFQCLSGRMFNLSLKDHSKLLRGIIATWCMPRKLASNRF